AAAAEGLQLTYLPFVAAATVRALREYPELNAAVQDGKIILRRAIHLSIAVEEPAGLTTIVLRNSDALSVLGLARALSDLTTRLRTGKLSPDDVRGGSFTLSNPGAEGNLFGTPIINQPQVGILRMGEIRKRPVVIDNAGIDAIAIRPTMWLALS